MLMARRGHWRPMGACLPFLGNSAGKQAGPCGHTWEGLARTRPPGAGVRSGPGGFIPAAC